MPDTFPAVSQALSPAGDITCPEPKSPEERHGIRAWIFIQKHTLQCRSTFALLRPYVGCVFFVDHNVRVGIPPNNRTKEPGGPRGRTRRMENSSVWAPSPTSGGISKSSIEKPHNVTQVHFVTSILVTQSLNVRRARLMEGITERVS